jgi:crotonobetainyl-CoA hydratase
MTDLPSEEVAEPTVKYQVDGHIATITLNRPGAMNAVNAVLSNGVGESLSAAAEDPAVRVVVLTGTGRAFCAGADLKELAQGHSILPSNPDWGFAGLITHWIDKPLISAVNGFAMGGGTELVLASDLAVASERAKFGLPEVKRGILAAGGGLVRLPKQIPMKLALEMALTGDPIDPETALRWGLINRVVEHDRLLESAYELAERIAVNAPLSVQHTKRAMYRAAASGSDRSFAWSDDPWEINAEARNTVFASRDAREGPRAFAEKRAPVWEGR